MVSDTKFPELQCNIEVYNTPFSIPIPHNSNHTNSNEYSKALIVKNNLEPECAKFDENFNKKINGEIDLNKLLIMLKDVSYDYEYLDHPADVILLGQGKSIKEALESISISLFNYISDLSYVEPKHLKTLEITGKGLIKLLYHFLDECLYLYSSEYFIAKYVLIDDIKSKIIENGDIINGNKDIINGNKDIINGNGDIINGKEIDDNVENEYVIRVIVLGDYYNKNKHKCGTEIKAITMHHLSFKLWTEDRVYEFKDMDPNNEFLTELNDSKIIKCKAFALVDI
ncbi:Archease protein family (MTH1598/TM1083) family protein [Theileria parva strain Muguga]|uniref:Archease domain-containing protein n=1 Tax=Theileria parva TaxID=5875 RepID=Q4N0U7_THEPA|nr:Archease protein family (MTH1598/TM1083) family protein [Theileria parva strain Muguga]EAN30746.1 Archease protein family (MTH1598/TM1083) family protein [Theileria parva strain Muguga]|eukprot:XP_763029.1 hypothetical protein [Theileria parva strain Muguga]